MMFDFWKFYKGLFNREDCFDDYWEQFPSGHLIQFKSNILLLIEQSKKNRDEVALSHCLSIIFYDGADSDYTQILLELLEEDWHDQKENIVDILEMIKDPITIDKLYEVAIKVPDYDDMRGLAKKCMWALSAINTPEAIEKLKVLQKSDDKIISENATFQLEYVVNKS